MKALRTGDQNLVKQINKSVVFHTIKNKGPISRAQVSKETGLNKATVSTMVSELLKESFVSEIGSGQSSGGRKPVMLYFNHHAGYSIGIDVGVNYLSGILTDLSGNIVEKNTSRLKTTRLENVINQMIAVTNTLMQKAPKSPYGIIGIGIGVPGLVDSKGQILFAPNLKWSNVNLKQRMEDQFQIPVKVENEANAGAHGEQLYGVGKSIANSVYISIGIGIGTGILINHQLYRGFTGIAGEMGHMSIDFHGRKCSCGNRGCWELYASESALLKAALKQNIFDENQEADLEFLFKEAQKGNVQVIQLLNTLGEYIGIGLTSVMNTFSPEAMIIGNRIARFEPWIKNPIERVLEERLSNNHPFQTRIRFSKLKDDSTALGAASFAISDFFSNQKITEIESLSLT